MTFDEIIERRGTLCSKWDGMQARYGVSPETGIAMWVADMDFRPPDCVIKAIRAEAQHGVFGYLGDETPYRDAIRWWMDTRHNWNVERHEIFTTHGLVNGTAMCLESFTEPGDAIVLFTPVYHAFSRVINAAGRVVTECPLALEDGRYHMDFDAYDALLTGKERMLILCSPHNPGGRVWTKAELSQLADFARRHDLLIVSDEIHHDLVMPGHTHIPMTHIEGIEDRLIMMTAPSKTFNIAGMHLGNVIIADPDLRKRFAAKMAALSISPNSMGVFMATAAYSPEGAAWVDELVTYLNGNREVFDAAVNAIPGLRSVPLEATYLSWVDFSGTGMAPEEFTDRVTKSAQIAANFGDTFGTGGETFLRFNIALPRARVIEATERLARAFGDLQ